MPNTSLARRTAELLAEWRDVTAGRLVADTDPAWRADWQQRKDALLAEEGRQRPDDCCCPPGDTLAMCRRHGKEHTMTATDTPRVPSPNGDHPDTDTVLVFAPSEQHTWQEDDRLPHEWESGDEGAAAYRPQPCCPGEDPHVHVPADAVARKADLMMLATEVTRLRSEVNTLTQALAGAAEMLLLPSRDRDFSEPSPTDRVTRALAWSAAMEHRFPHMRHDRAGEIRDALDGRDH